MREKRYLINTKALIKGDRVDLVGKKVLIIVIAALSAAYSTTAISYTNDYKDMTLIAVFNLEIACLTVAGKRVNRKWRCIPIVHFAVSSSIDIVKHLYPNGLHTLHLTSVVIGITAMTAGILLMKSYDSADNIEAELMSIRVRLCMLILLLMELYETMAGIVSLSGGLELLSELISRGLFFLAIMIMSLPEHGLLNIRRICITTEKMSIAVLLTFGTVLVMTHGSAASNMTNLIAGILFLFIIMTILICCVDDEISPDIEDEYEYDLGEKMLKGIGWCNCQEEHVNRVQYLQSAFQRDFVTEYSGRLYNNLMYVEDIALIQLRLKAIQKQLIMSKNLDNYTSIIVSA